jgi:hypothetical protein
MFKKFQALAKGGKFAYEMLVPKISKNLTKKFKDKQEGFKAVDEQGKNLDVQTKGKIKKDFSKKVTEIYDKYENKAKGGRVGLKRGTGLMRKKSDIQKIKEAFAPRVSKNKKASKFGMLSVKAGIDKNPNPTQADRIAGAKMKSKKRFV